MRATRQTDKKLNAYVSELNDEWRLSSLESTAVAVCHGQVDLPTVTPQLGRVNRQPLGKYPASNIHTLAAPSGESYGGNRRPGIPYTHTRYSPSYLTTF